MVNDTGGYLLDRPRYLRDSPLSTTPRDSCVWSPQHPSRLRARWRPCRACKTELVGSAKQRIDSAVAPRDKTPTLVTFALILGVLFSGVAFLAYQTGALPSEENSVISQLGEAVGGRRPLYFAVQLATTVILILAA